MEGREIAPEVDELAPVVAISDVRHDLLEHALEVRLGEAIRTADADVVLDVFAERHGLDAVGEVGLDHEVAGLVAVEVPVA